MKHARIYGLVAAATALCLATPSSGAAAPPEISPPLATGLAGPLQFDVGDHGQIYVGESFAGRLRRVSPAGKKVILVNDAATRSRASPPTVTTLPSPSPKADRRRSRRRCCADCPPPGRLPPRTFALCPTFPRLC